MRRRRERETNSVGVERKPKKVKGDCELVASSNERRREVRRREAAEDIITDKRIGEHEQQIVHSPAKKETRDSKEKSLSAGN